MYGSQSHWIFVETTASNVVVVSAGIFEPPDEEVCVVL